MNEITIKPLAFVKNDRKEARDDNWGEVVSEIVLVDEMPSEALTGIEEFSHLEILFHFHKADRAKIVTGTAHPRNNPDWPEVGIFCQRRKNRPNLLGLTVVELIEKKDRKLMVKGLDAIDGTPVIDIKPLTKGFLPKGEIRQPWWIDELMKKYWHKG